MSTSSSSPTALIPGFERSLAVVIGINSYAQGVPPLQNAVRDASAVADSLERQGFEVLRLFDAQASLSALSGLISHHLPSLQPPPDRLLLYFAGHGLAEANERHHLSGFLLPSDARRDEPSSYWPMASLRQALSFLPCRHLLLILDCCFAGAFPHSASRDLRAPSPPSPLFFERFRHFSSRRSFQLLVSTSHDELASDRLLSKPSQETSGSYLHSPFARALLDAFQPSSPADSNQDGLLTASELYTFLRDRLLTLLPSHSQQTPSLRHLDWHDGGEFLFLLSGTFPALPSAVPLSTDSNPYLGLRPFTSEDRHLFFGRERIIDACLERLRTQSLLLCGPSGAGKSSLVLAGLLPRLQEDSWRVLPPLDPDAHPLQALSACLSTLSTNAPSLETLVSQPQAAADFLHSVLSQQPHLSLVLVIDPLEEFLPRWSGFPKGMAFLAALSALLHLGQPRFRLVLLLRSDLESHLFSLLSDASLPPELWRDSRFLLPPMNRDELRRSIQKPAEASVIFFSSGLVDRLLDDVEQMPGALPLLSFALSELFDSYLEGGREDRTLSFEDYERLGGMTGILQRCAECVFAKKPGFRDTLVCILSLMVSTEGGELAHRRVSRSKLVQDLGPDDPTSESNPSFDEAEGALATLIASRLVVASHHNGPCVEFAHDALLSAFPQVADRVRKRSLSDRRDKKQSLVAMSLLLPLILLLIVTSVRECMSDRTASERLMESWRLLEHEPTKALLILQETSPNRDDQSSAWLQLALDISLTVGPISHLAQVDPRDQLIAMSPDCARLLLMDSHGSLGILSTHGSESLILLKDPPGRVLSATFDTDGSRILVASDDGTVRIWNADGQDSPIIINGPAKKVTAATFALSGSKVVIVSDDGAVRSWRPDGRSFPTLISEGFKDGLNPIALSPNGSRILTASDGNTGVIWLADPLVNPTVLKGHAQGITSATFNTAGSHILTTSRDGTARIWRTDGLGFPLILRGPNSIVKSAIFSADGSRVAVLYSDGSICLIVIDPDLMREALQRATTACLSPDERRLHLSESDDEAWGGYAHCENSHGRVPRLISPSRTPVPEALLPRELPVY